MAGILNVSLAQGARHRNKGYLRSRHTEHVPPFFEHQVKCCTVALLCIPCQNGAMKIDDFIEASFLRIKEAGLRPAVVHFDLLVHWNPETGEGTVIYGAVDAGGSVVPVPLPFPSSKLTGVRTAFSIPVSDWGSTRSPTRTDCR